MKFKYRKDAFIFLIIGSVLSLFGTVSITLEGAYPFTGDYEGIIYYILAVYFLLHAIICLLIAIRMKKLDARTATRRLAIFQFSALPILFLLLAILCLGFQRSYLSWLYYLNIASFSLIFLFNGFLGIYVSKRIIARNHGYVLVRAVSSMATTFSAALLVFYISTPIKVAAIVESSGFDPQRFIDNPFYFILTEIIVLFIIVIISLIMLFIGIMCYLSSRENNLVDLKHNVKFTKRTLKKYHVGFWFGIVFTLILFATSVASSISLFSSYISLAALYLSLLLIRLPTFFFEIHLHKKYHDEPQKYFIKIHKEMIYASIVMLLYTGVILFFGVTSPTKMNNPPSIYIVLFFLAPLNVTRASLSIYRQHKARKSGHPHIAVRTCTDIIVALFAIINTLIILGSLVQSNLLLLLGRIASSILLITSIGFSVFLLASGIKGTLNKRPKQLERYLVYHQKELEEELILLEQEKEFQELSPHTVHH